MRGLKRVLDEPRAATLAFGLLTSRSLCRSECRRRLCSAADADGACAPVEVSVEAKQLRKQAREALVPALARLPPRGQSVRARLELRALAPLPQLGKGVGALQVRENAPALQKKDSENREAGLAQTVPILPLPRTNPSPKALKNAFGGNENGSQRELRRGDSFVQQRATVSDGDAFRAAARMAAATATSVNHENARCAPPPRIFTPPLFPVPPNAATCVR